MKLLVIVETTVVPANLSLYFWCGSPTVAMPIRVSISQSSPLILLMSRIMVLLRVGSFPSIVVIFRYITCLPMVVPQVDSRNEAYRKKATPRIKLGTSPKSGIPTDAHGGSGTKIRIIVIIIPIIMLSIIPAMSLRSQWSCSSRSVPIFSNVVDIAN